MNEDFVRRTTGVCWSIRDNKELVRGKYYFESCHYICHVMGEDEISITCYVCYKGMDIVDKFCDKNDATMIPMSWMRTHWCKTLLTFLFKLTSSCFSSFFVLSEP